MERTGSSRKETTGVDGTEGGRRPTGVPSTDLGLVAAERENRDRLPDPEVSEKPVRRQFRADYKLRILEEADRSTGTGEVGALLRREGLYSSHLTQWRKQREQGMLNGLTPRKRGRKAKRKDPLLQENQRLRQEVEELRRRLKQAETIIDFQKKLSEILGIPVESSEKSESEE